MSNAIETWEYYKGRTDGLLALLQDDQLNYKPVESIGSLGRQLRHTADVRDIYIRSIEQSAGVSWSTKRMDRDIESSVEKLAAYFQELDERFNKAIRNVTLDQVIPWEDMGDPTVEACVEYMTQHEIFHQGVWVTFIAGLGIDYDISA